MSSTAFPMELKGPAEMRLPAPQFVDETTLPKTSDLTRKLFTDTIGAPAPGEAIELYRYEVQTLQNLQTKLQKEIDSDTAKKIASTIVTAILVLLFVAGIISLTAATGGGSLMVFGLLGTIYGVALGIFSGVITGMVYLDPNGALENAKASVNRQETTRLPISNLMMREEVSRFIQYYSQNADQLRAALKKTLSQTEESLSNLENLPQKPSTTQLEKGLAELRLAQEEFTKNSQYQSNLTFDRVGLERFFTSQIKEIDESLRVNNTLPQKGDTTALEARKARLESAKTLLLGASTLTPRQKLDQLAGSVQSVNNFLTF